LLRPLPLEVDIVRRFRGSAFSAFFVVVRLRAWS
jgi:hypothetical protein